ncbi:MAG: hypothetical protein L0H64_11610, partial [Pseudonocardia sp.]|nr:hypothetical protein [Pseudonocardia sp.]
MKVPAVARRAGWNLADQMIVSLTNAVLSFMVANAVSARSFGGFSVAFTVFALVIGASRALSTSPLNIRFSDAEPAEQARSAAHATGTALTLGFVAGAGSLVAGLLLSGVVGEALIAMGIVLPAVITQDALRYVFFSRSKPAGAAFNDAVWTVLQLGAVAVLLYTGSGMVWPLIIAWGASAAVAAALGARRAATVPDPRKTLSWLREHRNLTGYLFASFATAHGANQGAMLVIAAVGSALANGALRGAAILLGPVSIISSAAMTFAIPEFSRRRKTFSNRQWFLSAAGVSGVVAFLGLVWGSLFLLMPDFIGEFVLAETWQNTRELLLAAVVAQVFACATIGPVVMLYAIDKASATLVIQIVLGSLTFLGGVGGVILAGGPGAQWGFAVANALVVPFWFFRLWRELRKRGEPGAQADDHDGDPQPDSESTRFLYDGNAEMATMVLPRIEPRRDLPSLAPQPSPAAPGVGGPSPAQQMPPRTPAGAPGPRFRPPLPPGSQAPGSQGYG